MSAAKRKVREWNAGNLNIDTAKQGDIAQGDIVRSYDFAGMRDDCYVEGVVKTLEPQRVLIHVTREVWDGVDEQVCRFEVYAPLGVSSMSGVPCVFLIAKRVVRS